MNYERSPVTGRLSANAGIQTPSTLGSAAESAAITYPAGTTFPKELPFKKGGIPAFLMDKIKMFQNPSGVPIHLKGGPADKILMGSTLLMCGIGLAGIFHFVYDMSFPKKNDN